MSDTNWMESEAYSIADRINEALDKAYKQGVSDAWDNVKTLWNPIAWMPLPEPYREETE